MRLNVNTSLFPLGRLANTPDVLELHAAELPAYLSRHAQGDWGDICDCDKGANDQALIEGARLFSSYDTPHGKLGSSPRPTAAQPRLSCRMNTEGADE